MITIAIADDHEIFREGLVNLFSSDDRFQVVCQCDNGDELLELLAETSVDVAIIDVSMPGPGVLGIQQRVQSLEGNARLLVLTMHQDASMAMQFLAGGVKGFVLKRNAFQELRDAVLAVASGESFVSSSIAGRVAELSTGKTIVLTNRELDVVRLVADGHINQRIASMLEISVKTVQTHRARAMEKLNVHSATELVRALTKLGLLQS